jgi:hypothetical protein
MEVASRGSSARDGIAGVGNMGEATAKAKPTPEPVYHKVGVSQNRELVWLDRKKQIEPERLADYIVMMFMDLISRANRGEVQPPPL